jgi:hypothetical protein
MLASEGLGLYPEAGIIKLVDVGAGRFEVKLQPAMKIDMVAAIIKIPTILVHLHKHIGLSAVITIDAFFNG